MNQNSSSDNNDISKIKAILNDIKDQIIEYQKKIIQLLSQSVEVIVKQNQTVVNNFKQEFCLPAKPILSSIPLDQKETLLKEVKSDLTFLDYLYADANTPIGSKTHNYLKINSIKEVISVENKISKKEINNHLENNNNFLNDEKYIISELLKNVADEKLINKNDISFAIKINHNVKNDNSDFSNLTHENNQQDLINIPFIDLINKIKR